MKHFAGMASKNILFLFFIGLCSMIYGQECNSCSKFYYSFSNQSDSLDVNSKTSHVFVLMKKKDSTLFTDIQNKKADSLEAVIWADYKRTKSGTISYKGVPNAKYKYYISKDLSKPTNDIKVYDKIGTGNFMYEDDTKLQWELVNEKKQIAGFFCQKAQTFAFGRKFIAWFTTEIPISDGPYKFRGLPGLIVELYDDKKYFVFSLIRHLKNDNDAVVILPELRTRKLIETTKDKFVNAKKSHREGLVARIKNGPFSQEVSNERIKQIQDNLKKNNNQIELSL